ncbi:hypothetical protein ABL78_6433 [Leptomonas seymouri]|uniref:Uncharacterized protein n=1 Tax=Leptomonas seymouri TaxID=5684 RepID=A0A0N1HTS9_LEPSE|nr:hypothetical protein ABL78_6433 [Leptomonas seymouri]|eukprot:KPI84523.1 hypothetical protein ABL78_6433 [Leptomonas seymouri]
MAEQAAARQLEQRRQRANEGRNPGSQLVAEAGFNPARLSSSNSSFSWSSSSSEDVDDIRREEGLVPLDCDRAAFPFNRSTGVVFEKPAAKDADRSGVALATAASNGSAVGLPTTEVPVGMDYYKALQKAWSHQPEHPPKLAPLASEADVNISDIDAVLSSDTEWEELNPPVTLVQMISYFAEDWRGRGLYDVVQKREEVLSSQAQRR